MAFRAMVSSRSSPRLYPNLLVFRYSKLQTTGLSAVPVTAQAPRHSSAGRGSWTKHRDQAWVFRAWFRSPELSCLSEPFEFSFMDVGLWVVSGHVAAWLFSIKHLGCRSSCRDVWVFQRIEYMHINHIKHGIASGLGWFRLLGRFSVRTNSPGFL